MQPFMPKDVAELVKERLAALEIRKAGVQRNDLYVGIGDAVRIHILLQQDDTGTFRNGVRL
ncbi:hypothetical protein [Ectobacillus ponti]|uniref:Uncharacterized protein n=1 Tax=Ectobacillus ponti TaxID=2961894 RepID=A0AA41XBA9_9BACI|nr:hypothetical protein [Ectobacillus ponti]MCP8970533.1 hypothetical protein [Ectobacillus ponti]